jgi:GntR family transcriptional repressor for pyruvate dehydrogenase complex
MLSLIEARRKGNAGDGLASELVTSHVLALIAEGELKGGARLPPERELANELSVSRTSVRTGIQALAAKGVLVVRHGAGTFVADGPPALDGEPLLLLAALHGCSGAEMFEARRTLEVGVAGLAAERATPEDIAAMAEEVASMFASLDDPQQFLIHDIRFHRAVAAASGNRVLAALVEMVSSIFYGLRRRTADRSDDRRPAAAAHRRIYQAIRDHHRSRAEGLMHDHLLQAEREQVIEDEAVSRQTGPARRARTPPKAWPRVVKGAN